MEVDPVVAEAWEAAQAFEANDPDDVDLPPPDDSELDLSFEEDVEIQVVDLD